MSRETALSSNTVDDISQGIGSADISNEDIGAAAVCDMSLSKSKDTTSEEKCTSCDQKLDNVKTNDVEVDNQSDMLLKEEVNSGTAEVFICANCGKEGASNTCNKCKQVKYCNAACKKKHKTKHKKACERRVWLSCVILNCSNSLLRQRRIAQFAFCVYQHFDRVVDTKHVVGKLYAVGVFTRYRRQGWVGLCPFCRVPSPSSDKIIIEQLLKRVEVNDGEAIHNLGDYYNDGDYGLTQDHTKALELWKRAAELGHVSAYFSIGCMYYFGRGAERDEKKAMHYYELAAMRGCVKSRFNLGLMEAKAGNPERALKHFMIAVGRGHSHSLQAIQAYYSRELATKDVYAEALQAYQRYLGEIKSTQRDEAAAAREDYKYID